MPTHLSPATDPSLASKPEVSKPRIDADTLRRHPSSGLLTTAPWSPAYAEPVVEEAISVSQFYPFVLAEGEAKEGEVRSVKRALGMYTPAVDYWRLFRLQAAAYHAYRRGPELDALDTAIELAHPDRRHHYEAAVANYRRLIADREIQWIAEPRRAMWLAEGLQVRVNPELHITIDGEPHVVKLYLKADDRWTLNQRSANGLAYLLGLTHGHLGKPLVMDVMRGRLFAYQPSRVNQEAFLQEQAAAFVRLWRTVGSSQRDR